MKKLLLLFSFAIIFVACNKDDGRDKDDGWDNKDLNGTKWGYLTESRCVFWEFNEGTVTAHSHRKNGGSNCSRGTYVYNPPTVTITYIEGSDISAPPYEADSEHFLLNADCTGTIDVLHDSDYTHYMLTVDDRKYRKGTYDDNCPMINK